MQLDDDLMEPMIPLEERMMDALGSAWNDLARVHVSIIDLDVVGLGDRHGTVRLDLGDVARVCAQAAREAYGGEPES